MIHVTSSPEPDFFDAKVRKPGNAWLAKHGWPDQCPHKEPPSFWNEVKDELFEAYQGYCAYTTFRLNTADHGIVEHFLPKRPYTQLIYEWDNYRLAGYHVNSKKNNSVCILDPFTLPVDAFIMRNTPVWDIEPNDRVLAPDDLARAQNTIRVLGLNSPANRRARREFMERFMEVVCKPGATLAECQLAAEVLRYTSRFLFRTAQLWGLIPADEGKGG